MNKFSWTKAIGFGIAIWAAIFIVASIVVSGLGIALGTGTFTALAILAGILSYLFAIGTGSKNSAQALGYGVVFTAVGVVLDTLISYQFQSNIFSQWQYYLGYALVLLAPWIEYGLEGSEAHPRPV